MWEGAENDLVGRIYSCATVLGADVIVRLCADNPLIEASEIDRIVDYYLANKDSIPTLFTNTQNVNNNGYPDGLGAEV